MAEITLTAKWQIHKIVTGLSFVNSEEDWVITQNVPVDFVILPTPSCALSFQLEWLDSSQNPIDPTDLSPINRGTYNAKFIEIILREDGSFLIADGFEVTNIQGYQRVNQAGLGLAESGIALQISNIVPPTITPVAAEAAAIRMKALP